MMRLLLALLLLCLPAALHAQRPQAAVIPESITVGDVFQAAIRVDLPEGVRLQAPDTIAVPEHIESAGRRDVRIDSTAGGRRATLLYPLAAWRPGEYALPPVTIRLFGNGTDSQVTVVLPSFSVTSVLPADTAGVEPRAAKDVLGGNRVWWPILLMLLLAALAAAALYWWWRRRRPQAPVVVVPLVAPRAHALAQLDELQRAGLLERGEVKPYYERLTAVLRHYAAALHPTWGVDLTTSELSALLRVDLPAADALELMRILAAADMVKFARARPSAEVARAHLESGRTWVARVDVVPSLSFMPQRAA